jgi:hypothetical protein
MNREVWKIKEQGEGGGGEGVVLFPCNTQEVEYLIARWVII